MIFQDGSTAGDPVWVNAILARRLRFYDRSLSIHDLLEKQVGTGTTREALVALLQAAQTDADKQLPEDDLRVMDDLAFYGAISTIDNNRRVTVETVLERYLAYLRLHAAQLKRSLPALDTIRPLRITIPKPLSEATLPIEVQTARAALSSITNVSSLPYCSITNVALTGTPGSTLNCSEGPQNNSDYVFNGSFLFYPAGAKTGQDKPWSSVSSPGEAL